MVKNKPTGLNPEQFANAFPFHFGFDGNLVITSLGESMRHKVSGLELGSSLYDCFHFTRPNTEISLSTFSENPKTLYVLECRTTPLVLRGQFIPTDSNGFLFLGSPWFSNTEEMAAAGLTFNDFAIHDPVVDLLQLLQAQTISLQDIQAFAKRLGKQKEKLALVAANVHLEAHSIKSLALTFGMSQTGVIAMLNNSNRQPWRDLQTNLPPSLTVSKTLTRRNQANFRPRLRLEGRAHRIRPMLPDPFRHPR